MGRPPPCTITIARRGCCDAAPGPRSLRVDGMATRRTPAARLQVDIHIGRQYDSAVKIAVKAGVPRRPCELSSTQAGCLPPSATPPRGPDPDPNRRSEEHTSELQSLMRISYAVFCLQKNNTI